MGKELIRLADLSKFYTGSQSVVMGLNGINVSFCRGEFVAITGESGSGKSTLSHVLSGVLPYESGEMFFDGQPTSHYDSADWEQYRRDNISFISQNYGILPGATVLENVVSALLLTGIEKRDAHAAAKDLLKQVELWSLRSRRAAKLSSGQKQRLSIARALAKPAPVLIADEPTGNLDPENSAKVISLLAQTAKDRLVILVTHEFSEAEALATRHIVLQEGKLVMDAALRSPNEPEEMPRRPISKKPVSFYVARLQQRSRPIWSAFMVMFFALTAFAVFAFLGTFITNLDDSSTRIYDDSVFRNGNQQRIIVASMDGSPMNSEDYDTLVNLDHVERLEPNGYVTDLQYAYRENVDYELVTYETISSGVGGLPVTQVHIYAKMYRNAPYLQTIPTLPDGTEFLTAGRMPENLYEVVAQGDESLLGKTMTVYLSNADYWPSDQTLPLVVTVVGVTDYGSDLYFHEDLGRMCVQVAKTALGGYTFLPAEDLDDGHFRGHQNVLDSMKRLYTRERAELPQQKKLIELLPIGKKVFENINSASDSDNVILDIQSTEPTGYNLWHCQGTRYLIYNEFSKVWGVLNSTEAFGSNSCTVQFYPTGDTGLTENGTLTSGEYVIWCPQYNVALSTREVKNSGNYKTSYEAVSVSMENGILTGYTQEDIWDVEVLAGQYISISRNDAALAPTDSQNYSKVSGAFSFYWILEESKLLTGVHQFDQPRLIEVSYARFDELTWDGGYEQVSLTITDYGYTDRVLEQVQRMGYAALSPYQLGSNKQDAALAQEREQTLLICLLALVAVVVLQIILLRAMFTTQMESYRLLSNIGLSAKMARRSVLWQILTFAVLGQGVSIAALAVCWNRGVERIVHIIHYLPIGYMLILIAVHIMVSLAAVMWIRHALSKQVYALTGRESDLPMEENGKEAAV